MKVKEQKQLFQQARKIEINGQNESLLLLATVNHVPAFFLKGDTFEIVHALVSACCDYDEFIHVLKMAVDIYENSGIVEQMKDRLDKLRNAN